MNLIIISGIFSLYQALTSFLTKLIEKTKKLFVQLYIETKSDL